MKITSIKSKTKSLEFIQARLAYLLVKNGYDVNVNIINKSRIDIKGPHHGKGPQMLAYTYTVNIGCYKHGYRKSHKPTWDQYVQLNHLINNFLDKHNITANVRSLDYVVRTTTGGAEYIWYPPSWVVDNEIKGFGPTLETELEAQEYVYSFRKARAA